MANEIIKVLRVLEYEGTLEDIAKHLSQRAVKGSFHQGRFLTIREAILGEGLTIFQPEKDEANG